MKKFYLLLFALCALFSTNNTSAQTPTELDFTVLINDYLEDKFYPSLAMWNSTQEDPSDVFYGFSLNAPHAGAVIRITLEETLLNETTIIQESATEAGEMVITPIIKWKYDDFNKLTQSGTATLTCIVSVDGKEIDRKNQVVRYRPINECVFGMVDDEGEWVDIREQFAMYVNEDYPIIDKILQEILSLDRNRQFLDYQGSVQDFTNQLIWVWEYFSNKGTRYSNIVNTSNESEKVGVQYVRFIDQALNNVQANCVDGSALLASIYRKIGFDVYLVLIPGHCMLAIGYDGDMSIDDDLGRTGPNGGVVLMETTLMGANTDAVTSFRSAVSIMSYDELNRRIEKENYYVVDIRAIRAEGLMPIKR